MGGNSNHSSSVTNKSVKYGDTATVNPYTASSTNNKGTATTFNDGTALDTVYNFLNSNMAKLLDEYMNPSINSQTNQAKLNSFANTLADQSSKSLENDIISPLSDRNMLRSSSANDLYNSLAASNSAKIAAYADDIVSSSQNDSANLINNLLDAYMYGYNVIADNQAQSLNASKGNASSTIANSSYRSSVNDWIGNIADLLKSFDPATQALLNTSSLRL